MKKTVIINANEHLTAVSLTGVIVPRPETDGEYVLAVPEGPEYRIVTGSE